MLGLPVLVTEQYPRGLGRHRAGGARARSATCRACRRRSSPPRGPRASTSAGATRRSCAGSRRTCASARRRTTCSPRASRCTSRCDAVASRTAAEPRARAAQDGAAPARSLTSRRDGAVRAARRGRHRRVQGGPEAGDVDGCRRRRPRYVLLEDGDALRRRSPAAPTVTRVGEVVFTTGDDRLPGGGHRPVVRRPADHLHLPRTSATTASRRRRWSPTASTRARRSCARRSNREDAPGAERGWLDWLRDCGVPGDHRRRHARARAPHPRRGRDARRRLPGARWRRTRRAR